MTDLPRLAANTPGLPCRLDPEPFYSPDATERSYAAKQCHRCPLLLDCMSYALAADERHGVWGGVDFAARAAGCGTERGYWTHHSRHEAQCEACQAAHDEAVEADRRRRLGAAHAGGGSVRGYWLHRRLNEEACVPCKRAVAAKSAERRAREREACDRARADWDARKVAEELRGAPGGVHALAAAA
ncbi:WhiB family transcriptional regulator [Streptomyces umbrinus]|uniref:WhiB family transcriptional regulator n=1 Tax=Streptomyces umbrinus TaxID=67370 RepID=UPI003C2B443E